jgi:hypothetical protein
MRKRFFCLLAFLIVYPNVSKATLVQWKIEDGGNDHFYEKVVVTGGITWNDAKVAAELCGGYLATITSDTEQTFINTYVAPIPPQQAYWLGGYQPPGSDEPAGDWRWVTGEEFVYTNWYSLEPNNNGDENAMVTWYYNQWNDVPASYLENNGYIMETPEPATLLLLGLGGILLRRRQKCTRA